MEFIETPIFTKLICGLIPDDSYRRFQNMLILRPEAGDLIKHSGGLRKIRWNIKGTGKRGGLRIIYYWDKFNDSIYLLLVYKKTKKEDLTLNQLRIVKDLVKELLK